jgi:hypothetical protein
MWPCFPAASRRSRSAMRVAGLLSHTSVISHFWRRPAGTSLVDKEQLFFRQGNSRIFRKRVQRKFFAERFENTNSKFKRANSAKFFVYFPHFLSSLFSFWILQVLCFLFE